MATFQVLNFGCRANQADGALIERQLEAAGLTRVRSPAAVVVVNTCTVTAAADADARAAIRRLRRENPACRIVVAGCYAERAPRELAALPGVEWVAGNAHKAAIGPWAAGLTGAAGSLAPAAARDFVPLARLADPPSPAPIPPPAAGDFFAHTEVAAAFAAGDRARPNVKVQDGCNNRCSFCVIPSVRGISRSLPAAAVRAEIERWVAAGYVEVVLTGINLGQWGRDLEARERLLDLVRGVLGTTRLPRLRLSSVEPMDWSDELIALVAAEPRLAPHAHVPLQSGSDAVLRRMHRRYRPWHYADRVGRIRARLPDAAIGADVMVGFPGESDEEFAATCRFIEELPLTYLHVFTYSARPGTEAERRSSLASAPWAPVPPAVAAQRSRHLHRLSERKRVAFARQFLGRELEVVTLGHTASSSPVWTRALSGNFLSLEIAGVHPPNRLLTVRVESLAEGVLRGTVSQA